MEFSHTSVLLAETIEGLKIKPDGIYVDGTLGGGGHAYHIASQLSKRGRLIGIDRDHAAISAAGKRLQEFAGQVTILHGNYGNSQHLLQELGIDRIDGMVLDLGVSSHQLDDPERGFSYKNDTKLDMRMDTGQSFGASDIINRYNEADLFRIIRDYGEERFAKNIAKHLVKAREKAPIETTGQLNDIIRNAIPAKMRAEGGHPSKRTFQAIRIECNRELEVLKESLEELILLLNPGGRLCIITFHSLEDRIVKTVFRKSENPCTCPPSFPLCICGKESLGKAVTNKPILPTKAECEDNKRSKSAKLRIFERTSIIGTI